KPVDFWENGKTESQIDAATAALHDKVLLDLGEDWTPYLFTERGNEAEAPKPNAYRKTYLALAQERFPNDHHGERARNDKFLELYGILPQLTVLRKLMQAVSARTCAEDLDLTPLLEYEDFVVFKPGPRPARIATDYAIAERAVKSWMKKQNVATDAELDESGLSDADARRLKNYRRYG